MTSKTTPTPTIRVCPLNSEVVEDANGEWFAETNDPARASLIVKAVNEREGLLRALEEQRQRAETLEAKLAGALDARDEARALLSQARSEKP